jgi:hypothetical protein
MPSDSSAASSPTPRVALLLSGLPRQWQQCLPSQLELLKDYQVEVFFHFWDTIDDAEKAAIVALLKPRAYRFEAPQDFSAIDLDPLFKRDAINAPSRMFSQFYSWRGVGQIFAPYKNDYDVAMRSRADLQFVYSLNHVVPNLKPHEILIPWWNEDYLLSDLFAIGGVEPILYYHQLYDQLRSYAADNVFNPELMLTRHIEQRPDFRVYPDKHQYFFVRRAHMAGYTLEQAMAENPGRNRWLDPEIVAAHKEYHQRLGGEAGATHVENFRTTQLKIMVDEVAAKKIPD